MKKVNRVVKSRSEKLNSNVSFNDSIFVCNNNVYRNVYLHILMVFKHLLKISITIVKLHH